MAGPKSSLRNLIERYSDDIVMLDAIYMWAQNPTSMSAGYGVDENYEFIEEALNIRYSSSRTDTALQGRDAHETAELLRDEMEPITDEYSRSYSKAIYKARSHIKELFEELGIVDEFRNQVKHRVQEANESDQRGCLLLSRLLATKFSTHSKDEIRSELWPHQMERFSIYSRSLFDREPPSTKRFTELGIFNKLLWISSGSSRREPRYCVPEYLAPVVRDMEQHVETSIDSPDTQPYLQELFSSGKIAPFEQLLFGPNHGFSEDESLDLPLQDGIIHQDKEYHVVSPFVEEELRDQYEDRRIENLKEDTKVQTVLRDLREALRSLDKRHRPKSEFVDFTLDRDSASYQGQIVLEGSTIDIVLIDYLSELTRQTDVGYSTLLILVGQRIPEAKRQLKKLEKSPDAILIYGDEVYGLTSLKDRSRKVLSELTIRGYDLREVEIESTTPSPSSHQDFNETMDQYMDAGLWKGAVLRAGSEVENRLHQVYKENSTLPDPDQHKQVMDEMVPMDKFGLGNWIGYYHRTNLFEKLDDNFDIDRRYFDTEYLNTINELYKNVKHPPYHAPSPREAREVETMARNIVEETEHYLDE